MKRFTISTAMALSMLFFITACNNNSDMAGANEDDLIENDNTDMNETGDEGLFADWDANNDDYLDEEEYGTAMNREGFWDDWDWDTNDDNRVDRNEWGTGLYAYGDRDRDGQWNEEEWREFNDGWDTDWTWSDWDANADGTLDEDEWTAGYEEDDWFSDWDSDGDNDLTEDDYYTYTYGVYDLDDDGRWDEEEYTTYARDWDLEI